MTRQHLLLVVAATVFYWVGQLAVGTELVPATLFSLAILFGLLSIFAGGGLASALGCLNAILIGKFLLLAITVKILFLQSSDATLEAPVSTAGVMALGFAGLLIGTVVQSRLHCPQTFSLNRPLSNRTLLSFAIVLFVAGNLGYFAGLLPATQGEGVQTGGFLGIARSFGSLKDLAVVPPMLYLWRLNTRRWMTHPAILAIVGWTAVVGIFSTNKQDAMEPLAFFFLLGFLRYGFGNMRLWSLVALGGIYYAFILFPYSQYVRHAGGREGTFAHRLEVTKDTFWRVTTDSAFRSTVSDHVEKPGYFNESLAPFSRLAMVGEADRLIAATSERRDFTGWETITWGFKLMTPSILYPDKPIAEAGNFLGHYAGDIGRDDEGTQLSYGVMANFYNAFSFSGVFFGSIVLFALCYYWIRLFLGNARWEGTPSSSTLCFLWAFSTFQHSIVESAVSGVIASMLFPIGIGLVYFGAKALGPFLPRDPVESESFEEPVLEPSLEQGAIVLTDDLRGFLRSDSIPLVRGH